jgi:hypothetical protein
LTTLVSTGLILIDVTLTRMCPIEMPIEKEMLWALENTRQIQMTSYGTAMRERCWAFISVGGIHVGNLKSST